MRPRPCARRCGQAACVVPIVPVKFTANTRSSCSSVIDSIAPPRLPAASEPGVVHHDVERPNVSTARATGRAAPSNVEMSLWSATASPPAARISATTASATDGVATLAVELGAHVAHDDPHAPLGEQEGVRTTDATTSPGHDGDPAVRGARVDAVDTDALYRVRSWRAVPSTRLVAHGRHAPLVGGGDGRRPHHRDRPARRAAGPGELYFVDVGTRRRRDRPLVLRCEGGGSFSGTEISPAKEAVVYRALARHRRCRCRASSGSRPAARRC